MSHHEYECSKTLAIGDWPFYALIMAAMRKADTDNLERLKAAWPGVWGEFLERYHAPGGWLPGEKGAPVQEWDGKTIMGIPVVWRGDDDG